jgi:hypothetical protein
MFRRGFYVGLVAGICLSVTCGYFSLRALMFVGGENIAELGAKIHAFERNYMIEAQPVLGQYTKDELSEPSPAEVEQMRKDRAAKAKAKKKA